MATDQTMPVQLPFLSPSEAVADSIYRVLNGLDLQDLEMFKSGLHKDIVFVTPDQSLEGLDSIVSNVYHFISPLDTTHTMSNPRVYIEGNGKARLTSTVLSQHFRSGQGLTSEAQLLAGSFYKVNLVEEDGLWYVTRWEITRQWTHGDPSVFA